MNDPSQNPYQAPQAEGTRVPSSVASTLLVILAILAGSFTVFLGLCVTPLAWILRDGIGPDSTESSGLAALWRMFWTFYWGPAMLISSALLAGSLILRRRLIRTKQDANHHEG